MSLYTFGRFFEELLRIDPSHHFAGLRLNAWVSIVVFALSTAFFVWWQFFHTPKEAPPPRRVAPPQGPTMGDPARPSLTARLLLPPSASANSVTCPSHARHGGSHRTWPFERGDLGSTSGNVQPRREAVTFP